MAAANDAVELLITAENEINLDFVCANVNNIIFRSGTTLPPNCPGDRFQQGRLSRSIGTTDASGVQPLKIEGRFPIAQKFFNDRRWGIIRINCYTPVLQISSTFALKYRRTLVQVNRKCEKCSVY